MHNTQLISLARASPRFAAVRRLAEGRNQARYKQRWACPWHALSRSSDLDALQHSHSGEHGPDSCKGAARVYIAVESSVAQTRLLKGRPSVDVQHR